MSVTRIVKQLYLTPTQLGLNNVPLNVPFNSAWIDTNGANQLTFHFTHTFSTATRVDMFFEAAEQTSLSNPTPGLPFRIQLQDIPVLGATPLNDFSTRKTTGATTRWVLNLPLNYRLFRLAAVSGLGAGAGDLLLGTAILGWVG